jgi:hypothetical protein
MEEKEVQLWNEFAGELRRRVRWDVEKVDRMTFDVPEGPERWASRYFRLADEQAAVVDRALARITKTLKGQNLEARALELMAVEFLNDPNYAPEVKED